MTTATKGSKSEFKWTRDGERAVAGVESEMQDKIPVLLPDSFADLNPPQARSVLSGKGMSYLGDYIPSGFRKINSTTFTLPARDPLAALLGGGGDGDSTPGVINWNTCDIFEFFHPGDYVALTLVDGTTNPGQTTIEFTWYEQEE